MSQTPENWDQPIHAKGLPWRFILLPLELALVFALVWWIYSSMLTPQPVWQLNYIYGTRWNTSWVGGVRPFGVSTSASDGNAELWNLLSGKVEAAFWIRGKEVEIDAY